MAADEETIARHFLRARLVGGPTGDRAYDAAVPDGLPSVAVAPAIIWQLQSAVVARINGPKRAHVNMLYLVQGIVKTATYAAVDPISEWIEAQLDRQSHVPVTRAGIPIGTIVSCILDQPWRMEEAPNGVHYRHKGGIYRLMVLKA